MASKEKENGKKEDQDDLKDECVSVLLLSGCFAPPVGRFLGTSCLIICP